MLTKSDIEKALQTVIDRDTGKDVVNSGYISGIAVDNGKVRFIITIALADKATKSWLREACEAAALKLPGVSSVSAILTAESPVTAAAKPAQWNLTPIDGVKKIIAVASGKGGVGKSTTAVNIALALAASGKRAGLLDADIYGPSIPHMMGLSGRPEIRDNKMLPLMAHGVACMSIGFITDDAAVMRGPMISKTLFQLLRMTHWDHLDVLVVDMPPGTGDVHLSLVQQAPIDGAVIVTTPQQVALIDARKCVQMFKKTGVPILGVVENMSGSVFGSGGGTLLAEEYSVPLLGIVEMDEALPKACDAGTRYKGKNEEIYATIARRI